MDRETRRATAGIPSRLDERKSSQTRAWTSGRRPSRPSRRKTWTGAAYGFGRQAVPQRSEAKPGNSKGYA